MGSGPYGRSSPVLHLPPVASQLAIHMVCTAQARKRTKLSSWGGGHSSAGGSRDSAPQGSGLAHGTHDAAPNMQGPAVQLDEPMHKQREASTIEQQDEQVRTAPTRERPKPRESQSTSAGGAACAASCARAASRCCRRAAGSLHGEGKEADCWRDSGRRACRVMQLRPAAAAAAAAGGGAGTARLTVPGRDHAAAAVGNPCKGSGRRGEAHVAVAGDHVGLASPPRGPPLAPLRLQCSW